MIGFLESSLLPLLILLLAAAHGRDGGGTNKPLRLEVFNQPSSPDDLPGTLKLTEGATLNLTCMVASPGDEQGEVRLSWYLPNHFVEPQKRLEQTGRDTTSTLVISPVIETDTGDYECWARHKGATTNHDGSDQVKKILKVLIEPRRGACQPGQYQCEGKDEYCIATRYRCDSHDDCPAGDDESQLLCGHEPCKGKIVCPELDFRCIDPTEYCCDPDTNSDCKFMYPCCEAVMEFSIRNRLAAQYAKQQHDNTEKEMRESDLAYLHSTVYTIIGCAVAFIVIVLSLGVAICRLHILRKSTRNNQVVRGAGRAHPPITLHDLDIYFSERGEEDRGDFQHIGITYNINHGVQIMGRNAQPPPYSTTPRRGGGGRGPPPPYMSSENIAEPLLNTDDDNNNGDINGNSDMADNNVIPEEAVNAVADRLQSTAESNNALPAPAPPSHRPENTRRSRPSSPQGTRTSPPPRYPGLDRGGYSSTDTDTE